MDSSASTPFESATSSPRHSTDMALTCMYSSSTPTPPLRGTLDVKVSAVTGMGFVMPPPDHKVHVQPEEPTSISALASDDFDFSARFSEAEQPWPPASMSSADELFCNGRIRPLWYRCEDLIEWQPKVGAPHAQHADDGDHFDFKSSADYDFRCASARQSPYFVRKAHSYDGYNRRSQDEVLSCSPTQGKKESVSGIPDMQKPKLIGEQIIRRCEGEVGNKQATVLKLEESRGRCASNNKEGGARRARSLSPMRVFHMDDELPRQSFETDRSTHSTKEAGDDQVLYDGSIAVKVGRRTLKELLHASSRAEHRSLSKDVSPLGAKQQKKDSTRELNMKRTNTLWLKCLTKEASGNTNMASYQTIDDRTKHNLAAHRQHYIPPRVHTERVRHQTFLPYRHGLLSCLSFTSRSYRSFSGVGVFHSKSER